MFICAGIDEAGYGPLLGPLCVGCAVFAVEGSAGEDAPDLWRVLNKAVCRSRSDSRRRIAIEDSKKLKGANSSATVHPLKHLERGVLAMLGQVSGVSGQRSSRPHPASDADLFAMLGTSVNGAHWYQSVSDLPAAHTADELGIASQRLRRAMEQQGVRCAMMRCTAVDVGEFNAIVERTRSKASVNMTAALTLLDDLWTRWPNESLHAAVDRHGGRTHYREELQLAWPDAHIRILAEDERHSRYRLERGGSTLNVTFMPDAESLHLPVALASMTAKYVRELFMLRMNRFFAAHMPELKPTAGYYSDGRRFLEAVEPLIDRLNLPRRELIRIA